MANVNKNGELIRGPFDPSMVRGDTSDLPMNTSVNTPAVGSYPCDYSGDATNGMGSISGSSGSSGMFEKFARLDNESPGDNSATGIGSANLGDTGSMPPGEEMADEQKIGAGDTNPSDTAEDKSESY